MIEQSKAKKKSLYCCFVDFKKAFDIAPREVVWQVLASLGVEGRFLRCLQVMYAKDTICINHPSKGVTSKLQMPTRCEARLSSQPPTVWVIFGCPGRAHGQQKCDAPALANLHVWLLFFADDLVLMLESEVGLQQQLNTLQ